MTFFFPLFESHRRKRWRTGKGISWSINISQGLALEERGKGLSRAALLPLGKGQPQPSAHAANLEHKGPNTDPLLPLTGGQHTNRSSIWPGSPGAISWVASLYLDKTVACAQASSHPVGQGGCSRAIRDLPPKGTRVFVFGASKVPPL